ncbi:type II secretory pathway protein [Paraburkholderia diazotrophica]|uniref:Type IVB pilus formation outer membrane protein, R64 PilN family n=1 Tax=Paraburkholderia diazotrophica TaxID=667676 RepID=A0A1H7E8I5_9BURK|nr:type II secretory pathway protein [Paraburkholderia diazotrophica]SEK10246.1 type IVB pilus formation outer membrane protein, R64 PilN family [Paraburkholderia diazotrophica]
MRANRYQAAVSLLVASMLTGCVVSQNDVNKAYDSAKQDATNAMAGMGDSMSLVEHVPTAFLGDRLVPVAYEATLPAIFREKTVTLPANLPVSKIATLISDASGYPVHLSPDVFIPRDALIETAAGNGGNGAGKVNVVPGQAQAATNFDPIYRQPGNAKLGRYLHGMTEDLGLAWNFDGSTINISRFVTRTFQIAAVPGAVSIKSSMSKGTDTSTGTQSTANGTTSANTGSFAAVTSTGRDGKFDQIDLITKELESLKSPLGKITVNPHSRLVMVRDTKEAVDRMSELLTRENAISTRQVSIRVRTVQIALNDGSQAGASADVVFNRISDGLLKYTISVVSPTSLATSAGSVGLSILKPNAPLTGTNAVINALNTYGKTVMDNTQTKMTLNGLPMSIGSFETKGYLAATTPATGTLSGGAGLPGLTPGSVTVGDFVNILPSVNDHNQIILSYWSDSSKLNGPFTTIGTGSGASSQQIQLPDIVGSKDDQTIALSDGQTVVMYGAVTNNYDGASNTGILGFSGAWNKAKTFQVIMLTANVVPSM